MAKVWGKEYPLTVPLPCQTGLNVGWGSRLPLPLSLSINSNAQVKHRLLSCQDHMTGVQTVIRLVNLPGGPLFLCLHPHNHPPPEAAVFTTAQTMGGPF